MQNYPSITPHIASLLQICIHPVISKKCRVLSSALVNTLMDKCHLGACLADMRGIFLMESGYVMSLFCTALFDKIDYGTPGEWKDTYYLEYILEDALSYDTRHDANGIRISLTEPQHHDSVSPLALFTCLQLDYQLKWPLGAIVTKQCLNIYNQIFVFLLQIKRVKSAIDSLAFSDVYGVDTLREVTSHPHKFSPQTLHKLHLLLLLRIRLTHFVNTFHSYIMTRIIHSTSVEFQQLLETAKSFDDIQDGHLQYVCKLHQYCLLHDKVRLIKQSVMSVLDLVLIFTRCWKSGVANAGLPVLEKIEHDLTKFTNFLITMLTANIKRGAFPHLEGLAVTLSGAKPDR